MNAFGGSPLMGCALVAAALVFSGGCASDRARARSPTATLLSEKLARVHAPPPSAGEAGAQSPGEGAASGAPPRHVKPLAVSSPRPRPRALDPVPPLYVPPPRDLPLQPVLFEKGGVPLDGLPRPSPLRRDPLAGDPLRRIDPLTGRDPLGRPGRRFDLDAGRR